MTNLITFLAAVSLGKMSRCETAVRRNVKSFLRDFTFHLGFLESGCPSMQTGTCTASPAFEAGYFEVALKFF